MINDILDFSKIEAGKLELEILNFDLRTTLEDISEVLAVKAHEKYLELTFFIDPEAPSLLKGDPGRLRQIIVNLVGNAVKFTHAGEVAVEVNIEKEEPQTICLRFTVTDIGIGIPSNRLKVLFSPFTQLDGSTTRKFGGTGLGLSISKQLTELMGGKIGIESREGEGTTFWFTARFGKQSEQDLSCVVTATEIRDVHMLIVDDHKTNRLLVTTLLHSWGCRCEEAMDCQMPEMDGYEAARKIRQGDGGRINCQVPVIAMTAHAMKGDRERCIEAGMNDYIPKPVNPKVIAETLERWIFK